MRQPLALALRPHLPGTRITFLDANHCPGAALIAAQPPGGAPPVLHTGDARLTRAATQGCAVLQGMRGRAVLVLDTTYCDPQYCFPGQQEVVDGVIRAVKVRRGPRAGGRAAAGRPLRVASARGAAAAHRGC